MSLTVDSNCRSHRLPECADFAGNHPMRHFSKQLFSWLRRLARHGSVLGGVDTGAFILAEARLLDDYEATVHRESITTFRERYTKTKVTERLFVIDRDRISCAGGHATLDLMLNLIVARQGTSLAQIVANSFISPRMRQGLAAQRIDPPDRPSKSCNVLTRILHHMEEHVGEPLSSGSWLRAGLSVRALSRVVREHTGEPPMRFYRKVRLQAARDALFYSESPIQDVAISCGSASPEVFSAHSGRILTIAPEFRLKTMDELSCNPASAN